MYRSSPLWLRRLIGRALRPLGWALHSRSTIQIGGHKMILDFADNASFKYLADRETFEQVELRAFLTAIKAQPGCTVVDVGANYGAYTLAAGNLVACGAAATIVAIEPDRRPYTALTRSIALNHYSDWCTVQQVIASDVPSVERLWVNGRSSADNRTHAVLTSKMRVRESYHVAAVTVDSIIRSASLSMANPLVAKLDIQGNELRALRGMHEVLEAAKSWVLFFEYAPYLITSAGLDPVEFQTFIRGLNIECSWRVGEEDLVELDGRHGLLAELRDLKRDRPGHWEGATADFVVSRGVEPEWPEIGARSIPKSATGV